MGPILKVLLAFVGPAFKGFLKLPKSTRYTIAWALAGYLAGALTVYIVKDHQRSEWWKARNAGTATHEPR